MKMRDVSNRVTLDIYEIEQSQLQLVIKIIYFNEDILMNRNVYNV